MGRLKVITALFIVQAVLLVLVILTITIASSTYIIEVKMLRTINKTMDKEKIENMKYQIIENEINKLNDEIRNVKEQNEILKSQIALRGTKQFDDSEIYLIAQIVHAEAKGEPFEGKVAVANVVLNRLDSEKFPNTIKEIIYQKGQFQPVRNGKINNTPSDDAINAVKYAIKTREDKVSLYFYNPTIATDKWIRTRKTIKQVGNHIFAL